MYRALSRSLSSIHTLSYFPLLPISRIMSVRVLHTWEESY
jgi:hypothetical protein